METSGEGSPGVNSRGQKEPVWREGTGGGAMGGPALNEGANGPIPSWPTAGGGACGYWRGVPTAVSCGCLERPSLGCGCDWGVEAEAEAEAEPELPAQGPLGGAGCGSARGLQFPKAPSSWMVAPWSHKAGPGGHEHQRRVEI